MPLPSSFTFDLGAVNLFSTATEQHAIYYTQAGEIRVAKRNRAGWAWQIHQLAGAARDVFNLPVTDEHNYPSVAQGTSGHVWAWANMHSDALKMVRSVNPGDITSWQRASLPSEWDKWTYPTPVGLPDGSLYLYMRAGNHPQGWAANSDSYFWTLPAGSTVWSQPTLIFKGAPTVGEPDTANNFSAYPSLPIVDGQGRLHLSWVWRQYGATTSPAGQAEHWQNYHLSYAYREPNGVWRNVQGQQVALPFTPDTTAVRTNRSPSGAEGVYPGWQNGHGMCIDFQGRPFMLLDGPTGRSKVWWDGTGWQMAGQANVLHGGWWLASRANVVWRRGGPWALAKFSSPAGRDHIRLARLDGTTSTAVTGRVSRGAWGSVQLTWGAAHQNEPSFDLEAYRRFGSVEVLYPTGDDRPQVFGVGP